MLPVTVITITLDPDLTTLQNQLSRLNDCQHILIIDNGSALAKLDRLRTIVGGFSNVKLIECSRNLGIAEAQNIGVAHAGTMAKATSYFLFLDHDTVPDHSSVATMIMEYETLRKRGCPIGALGPALINEKSNFEYGFQVNRCMIPHRKRHLNDTLEVDYLNSSGTLVERETLKIVGKFNSEFFIDHVETDWCLRAKNKGFRLYGTGKTKMHHEMGDETIRYWFLGERKTPYRRPIRHYYIFRNSVALHQKSYTPTHWKLLNVIKLSLTLLFFGVGFTKGHAEQREMILRGIKDGFKGVNGEFKPKPCRPET